MKTAGVFSTFIAELIFVLFLKSMTSGGNKKIPPLQQKKRATGAHPRFDCLTPRSVSNHQQESDQTDIGP